MSTNVILAKSKAGHDKNHIYVVKAIDEEYVYLINGKTRKMDNPKRKKAIHIQQIKNLPDRVVSVITSDVMSDELAIAILKSYQEE